MNSLRPFILLATVMAMDVGDRMVDTIEVNCEFEQETCTIVWDVDYRPKTPSHLKILNADDDTKDITRFKMFGINYETMPTNLFQLFPQLVTMHISTGLEAITKENFAGGSKLRSLILSNNKITEIKAHTFDGMNQLEEIYLGGNNLTKVEVDAFVGAINLKHLDLSSNNIHTFDVGAFNIRTLVDIDLSYNKFQTLADDVFAGCPDVTGVYLYGNQLTRMGKSINSVPKLSTFLLANRNIKIVDFNFYSIARNPHLRHMTSRGVGLVLDDPASAANDSYTAEHLDITGNGLSYPNLLHRLRNFRNLTWLEIGQNNLTTIDDIENILSIFPKLKRFEFDELPCKDDVIKRLHTKFGDKVRLVFTRSVVFN